MVNARVRGNTACTDLRLRNTLQPTVVSSRRDRKPNTRRTYATPSGQETPILDRRRFLTDSSMALAAIAGSALAGASSSAWAQPTATETVEVKTAYGRLGSKRAGDLVTFKGIPYAGPVSGENRFKAPPPLRPWIGVRDAFTPGPPSFQPSRRIDEPPPSEDCLVLNIWTPAVDHRRRPVMFYNHGGGFVIGAGSSRNQDGSTWPGNTTLWWWQVTIAWDFWISLLGGSRGRRVCHLRQPRHP